MTPAEAAFLLQVHPVTLRRWRADGTGPKHKRVKRRGRLVFAYDRAELERWGAENGYPVAPGSLVGTP